MSNNRIYLSKIDPLLPEHHYQELLHRISAENRTRCQGFRLREDALRTLYGELMVRHLLCRDFAWNNEAIAFGKDRDGKPFVKDFPFHFNLSHSGDFVVCAFGTQEIGVDVEQIKPIDLQLAKRYFHPSEHRYLLAQKEDQRLDCFFSLWTLKESYMKYLGKGMSIPLDSFFFQISATSISVTDLSRNQKPHFKQFPIDGYKLSLCQSTDDFPCSVEEIDIAEMKLHTTERDHPK